MNRTLQEFDEIISLCRDLFVKKMSDYKTSWRIMRCESLTDQISIKARRIRNIEQLGMSKVGEDITSEYIGIVNYAVMAQIQLAINPAAWDDYELADEQAVALYDKYVKASRDLLADKNHDYGEAWRTMRLTSFTDIILMKLLRIKQIEDNKGKTLVSEGLSANYYDIFNYAVFALIKLLKQ